MNLALPALVILLGLLPGICCFYGYFAGKFDKRQAGVSGVEQLALFVVFAIPIDTAALWMLPSLGLRFDFNVVSHLLMGGATDDVVHNEIVKFFQDSTLVSGVWYFVLLGTAFGLGSIARRFVWACRLDTKIRHLRLRHEWFYILQGRKKGYPRVVLSYVDVMTRLPDTDGTQTRLYRGLVAEFELAASGELESLTLKDAVRGSGRKEAFVWKPIPSTNLLIMGSTIHSINITYVEVQRGEDAAPPDFRERATAWIKSFVTEDP